jgi:hypothetical protein
MGSRGGQPRSARLGRLKPAPLRSMFLRAAQEAGMEKTLKTARELEAMIMEMIGGLVVASVGTW